MSIEKSLYQAPVGLESLTEEPALEIEIEDPESVTIGMGDLVIELGKEESSKEEDFDDNSKET